MDFEKRFDVLVAGAGIAGVAAALECARSGLKTALVEKTVLVGGLATAGLVYVYLPLCDGNGTQVTYGIAEELLCASMKYGPGDVPPGWRTASGAPEPSRYRVAFSPAAFVLAMDELLEDAGVELWLDTLVVATVVEGDRVLGVEVENKSGRGLLRAACTIDATGDADVAYRAGAACEEQSSRLSLWALGVSLQEAAKAVDAGDGTGLLSAAVLGGWAEGFGPDTYHALWHGTDGRDVSRFVIESRKLLRQHYVRLQAEQGRTTRRIVGADTLSDGGCGRRADNSVGLVADWRKPGCVWEIPYGALTPERTRGLLVAGRCISSAGDAWEVTRVIPAAALTGEAAGVAATLAAQSGATPESLDLAEIQGRLAGKGVPLHIEDLPR